jgi:hypothetical protein
MFARGKRFEESKRCFKPDLIGFAVFAMGF